MSDVRAFGLDEASEGARQTLTPISVFLGGPFIDPNKEPPAPSLHGGAANLRHQLYRDLDKKLNCSVRIGEMPSMQQQHVQKYGDQHDLATMEVEYIISNCDAVIILPSSPGSFAELGHFCAFDKICNKMMILANYLYQNDKSYINYGPIRVASFYYSTTEYVDYDDYEIIWRTVSNFISKIRAYKMRSNSRVT